MGKQTHVAKLETDIAEAYRLNEQSADAADKARAEYESAISAGNFDDAKAHQSAAAEHDAEARRWKDRIDALEAKRPEAESKDAMPTYRQAQKEAQGAIQAEADCHQRVAEAIQHLSELRRELDQVHSAAGGAIAAAHRAADAAHQPRDEFKQRSRFEAVADLGTLADLSRELRNMAGHQAQTMQAARERARKAA
ncbi:hypothetical protein [Thioalkalivibrio halophilus]|uniref:Uncharacterized protein n=1 Tax=Thioalkalivibrio halophilus TaxID=252474 RepID=A0A1V3A1U0_9GAMM|nr:hypothetical protein [Thioalkalivibrio halophilus]OOC11337.1 hypothetical protein B1A74_00765 [Thioalkalivibrio halophilus]